MPYYTSKCRSGNEKPWSMPSSFGYAVSAAVLDKFFRCPQVMHNWFINIVCSWQVAPRRVNQPVPETVSAFSGTVFPLRNSAGRTRAMAA
jgi:hypothetical protein